MASQASPCVLRAAAVPCRARASPRSSTRAISEATPRLGGLSVRAGIALARVVPAVAAGQRRSAVRCAAEGGSGEKGGEAEKVPQWAEPGSSTPPPWAREGEAGQAQTDEKKPFELPFGLALLFSVFTCIATVGSIFEYTAKNDLFGVVPPENPIWAPVLLFFIITGFPTTALLLFKAVEGFNKFADEEDRKDGL